MIAAWCVLVVFFGGVLGVQLCMFLAGRKGRGMVLFVAGKDLCAFLLARMLMMLMLMLLAALLLEISFGSNR